MKTTANLNRCTCGRMPKVRVDALTSGAVLTWVECPGCGTCVHPVESDEREDACAVSDWNAGKGRKW